MIVKIVDNKISQSIQVSRPHVIGLGYALDGEGIAIRLRFITDQAWHADMHNNMNDASHARKVDASSLRESWFILTSRNNYTHPMEKGRHDNIFQN